VRGPIFEFEKEILRKERELKRVVSAFGKSSEEVRKLSAEVEKLKEKIYRNLSPWQRVQIARHPARPKTLDYLRNIFSEFVELKGDRLFRDDPAIVGGLARIESFKVVVIGHQKGRDARESAYRNFGMPHPEGYRKAIRLMKLADKFLLPLITFIDTPGAYPGVGAEERGQAWAIAESIKCLFEISVPVISVNIGEGGSGGALALGVANRLFLLENSYYSVITPEGCASIIWGDSKKAAQAAATLKLTSKDLLSLDLIDGVIKEPLGGAHKNPESVYYEVRKAILENLQKLVKVKPEALKKERREKFRRIGEFSS
jgi:acetyl-CoA carboxylase carboxyl transferase subunit alpha